jgi:hypothetical protein
MRDLILVEIKRGGGEEVADYFITVRKDSHPSLSAIKRLLTNEES